MADLDYVVSVQEDGWYLAVAKPAKKGSACITCEGETYEELKKDILSSVQESLQWQHHEEMGIPNKPSIAVRFTEELYPGSKGEAQVVAERNCKAYQTKPNGLLNKKYSHKTVEGLRDLVREAIHNTELNGKKITFVLEEVLPQ